MISGIDINKAVHRVKAKDGQYTHEEIQNMVKNGISVCVESKYGSVTYTPEIEKIGFHIQEVGKGKDQRKYKIDVFTVEGRTVERKTLIGGN